jgi:hypothetical protein
VAASDSLLEVQGLAMGQQELLATIHEVASRAADAVE